MENNSSFIESHGNIPSHSESAHLNIQHINILQQRQTSSSDLEYWTDRLRDKEKCFFPVLNNGLQQDSERKGIEVRGPEFAALDKFRQHHQLKWSTLFQTAWGLVIRIYSGLDEVCFGFGQNSSTLLPCSLKLVRESSLLHTLDTVGVGFSKDSKHRKCSLKDIEAALDLGKAGFFNTSVVLLDHEELPEDLLSHESTAGRDDAHQSNTNGVNAQNLGAPSDTVSMIEVKIIISRKAVSITLDYCLSDLSDGQAANVASAPEQALACLLKGSHQSIGDQDLFSQHHQQQVQQWNQLRPSSINMTLHEAISTQVEKQPEAQAINAWDEQWTYRQMDELSSKLACHLVAIGVKTGINVPPLFERSGWWVIALLAVSKSGRTFVPVDPEMPLLRLKEVMMDVKPKILLCSNRYSESLASTVENTVVVSRSTIQDISKNARSSTALPKVSPEHVAYIMFTSGSTGQPKGAMIRHGGYLGALLRWVDGPRISPGSHVLQASSYAWSVCIIETICALWHGACLCIPSEYSKQNDLAGVFNDMHITWALLSPSIVKSIQPESIKYLKNLILVGEPVSREVVSKWASEETKVWIAWAATECLAITGSKNFTSGSDVQNLGLCRGVCRVVEMGNHERQVPIGAVGEIVVHAPWIADGYLNDAESTANTFLDRPDWLDGVPSSYGSRWYKVGDLVRQNSDGSLMLAGRGDNIVKIRGQRFDMSEVERKLADDEHIRNSLPILPKVGICKHRLVAMVALHGFAETQADVDGKIEILKGDALQKATAWLSKFQQVLANRLQTFAVPTIWFLVKEIPLTITGKIDRVAVKRFVERMDLETYEEVTALGVERQPPITTIEKRLAKIWSDVLELPLERVGRNQSFISLGGDSILAMIVGSHCRDGGIQLSVQDILKHSTIAELSPQASPMIDGTLNDAALAGHFDDLRVSIRNKLQQANVDTNSVEDCYPSSPMVTGMLLSKARLTGDYNTFTIYEVVPRKAEPGMLLSVEKLFSAWQEVVQMHATLRSFFIERTSQRGAFDQIVLRKYNTNQSTHVWNVTIDSTEDVIVFFNKHQPKPPLSLSPPHNFSILHTTSGRLFRRLNVEHTLVDGMSLAVIVSDIKRAYDNNLNTLSEPPLYSSYIASIQQVVCSVDNKYWKAYLERMHPCLLPNLTYSLSREAPKAESRALGVEIRNPHHLLKFCQSQELTLSALFRTVWGLILRAYTGSDEVCFGYITSGRDLTVPGIGEIVGTFINMLVCRMDLKGTRHVKDIIAKAQSDYLASLPHQHASLAQIQHVLGLYGQRLFNTSMTILKQVPVNSGDGTIDIHNIHEWSPNEYDLDVQVWTSSTGVKTELWYRSETISDQHAHNIASTFSHALEMITDDPDQRIDQLNLFAPEHGSQLWKWNAQCPESIDTCLHDFISYQASRRPHEIAVHSWDIDLTFNQLEVCSDRLAHHLVSLGIGPEVHVLHCFEKSALAIVAMLSILKAGGICVSIDPTHPSQRLQRIIKDTRPLCCLVSSLHEGLFQSMEHGISHVVAVRPRVFDSDGLPSAYVGKACSSVGPANAAFVLFTSGSTGTPKGIVHEHRTIASSLHHHGLAMKIGVDARTLQFSAFVFDVSITEIFMSLTRGGTLCIPSEDERMNSLESSINRMKANWAHLTPTVASLLDPVKVPTLKHLALAGEPLKKINVTEWAPNIELVNLYGPAECALATTLRVGLDENDRPDNIGKAVGLLTWLVDPSNTDRLVPLGAVGEILLEGPNIAREYLKDKERTLSSFIENPAWLQGKARNPPRRFYRSGDLARYNGDGSIQILGRIDTQVKMHGQRVELGEIEYQIRANLSNQDLGNLAVVYAKSSEHPGGGLPAAFLEFRQVTGRRQ